MDRTKAQALLVAYGRPSVRVGNTKLTFARQDETAIEEIEKMTDIELVDHYKALVWMNEIYGMISLNEMQRIALMDLEINVRPSIDTDALKAWYQDAQANFKDPNEPDDDDECYCGSGKLFKDCCKPKEVPNDGTSSSSNSLGANS